MLCGVQAPEFTGRPDLCTIPRPFRSLLIPGNPNKDTRIPTERLLHPSLRSLGRGFSCAFCSATSCNLTWAEFCSWDGKNSRHLQAATALSLIEKRLLDHSTRGVAVQGILRATEMSCGSYCTSFAEARMVLVPRFVVDEQAKQPFGVETLSGKVGSVETLGVNQQFSWWPFQEKAGHLSGKGYDSPPRRTGRPTSESSFWRRGPLGTCGSLLFLGGRRFFRTNLGVFSISILSRDPNLSRKPPETHGKRIRFSDRRMAEKNGQGMDPYRTKGWGKTCWQPNKPRPRIQLDGRWIGRWMGFRGLWMGRSGGVCAFKSLRFYRTFVALPCVPLFPFGSIWVWRNPQSGTGFPLVCLERTIQKMGASPKTHTHHTNK